MPKMIIKPVTEDVASCHCCDARNYKSRLLDYGHVVPVIFDVKLGTNVTRMCPDCLKKLGMLVTATLNQLPQKEG